MAKYYKCEVCGLILEEGQLEDTCPKCAQPKDKFHEMAAEDATKVERSELTNDLYAQMIELCNALEEVAEVGVEDNLDPSCAKIFARASKEAKLLKQLAKAEVAGHVSKGKW